MNVTTVGEVKMSSQVLIFICLLVFAASDSSVAAILSPKSISQLTNAADTIVVAKGSVQSYGEVSGTVVLLEVRRVLKGKAPSMITVQASGVRGKQGTLDRAAFSGVQTGSYGVWFLKDTGTGLQLLPVSDDGELALAYPAAIAEPAKVLPVTPSSPEEHILVELAAVASTGLEDAGAFLVEATYGTHTSIDISVFQHLTHSEHQEARLAGYSGLIIRSQPSGLVGFESELAELPKLSPIRRSTVLRDLVIIGIADEYRNNSLTGLDILGRLAGLAEQWPQISEAASMALRAIHSRESLPLLTTLLDSPNFTVRFNAVFGIASFANGLPISGPSNIANMGYLNPEESTPSKNEEVMSKIPSLEAFRHDPQYYINYWRGWVDSYTRDILR